jgi:hypothetical protein
MLKIFRFFGLYCKRLRLFKSLNFFIIKLIVYFIGYMWVSLPCFMLNSMTWLNIFVKECSLSTNHEKNNLHEQGQYVSIHHYFLHPCSHVQHSILTLNVKNMWLLTRLMLFTFIFFYHTSIFNMCLELLSNSTLSFNFHSYLVIWLIVAWQWQILPPCLASKFVQIANLVMFTNSPPMGYILQFV